MANEFEIPTVADLVSQLARQCAYLRKWGAPSQDVRLCVDPGHWYVMFGPVDYDTSHAEYCSANEISAEMTLQDLANVATYLIDDVTNEIEDAS